MFHSSRITVCALHVVSPSCRVRCDAQSYTALCEPNVKVPDYRDGIHHGTRQGDAGEPNGGDLSAVLGGRGFPGVGKPDLGHPVKCGSYAVRAHAVAALLIASPILPILYGGRTAGRFDIDARFSFECVKCVGMSRSPGCRLCSLMKRNHQPTRPGLCVLPHVAALKT